MQFSVPIAEARQFSLPRRAVELRAGGAMASLAAHLSVSEGSVEAQTDLSFLDQMDQSTTGTFTENATADAFTLQATISHWSQALENQFAHLAARIASDTATADDRKKLEQLQRSRQQTYLARHGDQVLRDFERRQRTAELVRALQRYVEITPR